MPLTASQIDEIVHSVLKQIQHVASPSMSGNKPQAVVIPGQIITEKVMTDKIITAETLQQLTVGQRLIIPAKAIITPAARDVIKQLQLQCETAQSAKTGSAASLAKTAGKWLGLTVETSSAWEIAAKAVRQAALSDVKWELADSTERAAETAISELNRGSLQGVLIVTDRVATAACLANRHERVRAAGISRLADLAVLDELQPNVVCLPSRGPSHAEALQMLRRILIHSS